MYVYVCVEKQLCRARAVRGEERGRRTQGLDTYSTYSGEGGWCGWVGGVYLGMYPGRRVWGMYIS